MNLYPSIPVGTPGAGARLACTFFRRRAAVPWLLAATLAWPAAAQPMPQRDHDEFEAFLAAPYRADTARTERQFELAFSYPGASAGQRIAWQLALRAPDGRTVARWRGTAVLADGTARHAIPWRPQGARPANGIYRLLMTAFPDGEKAAAVEQERRIVVGEGPAARLRTFAAPAEETPPEWDIYLGNLHSQTGHSDGGGPLDNCKGAQHPQSASAGPADAYAFARQHGLQFLLASEHNHMYDGSEGTEPSADPQRAIGLYKDGLAQAAQFTEAHPGFVALYGLEWGLISNGGHLNILNSPELLEWERNGAGELLGDTFTAKGDYGALYALMAERGWLGQFNHPSLAQFRVAGQPLGYSADGDKAMALCEVMNSNAFSTRTDESETRLSFYEKACQRALEAGFHMAFSSNQDNHCANWGASSTNRTGILLPRGTPPTQQSLLEGIRARRVFATMDKASTLELRANGRMMGERIVNHGTLTLALRFTSDAARTASEVVIVHGVPGRNGEPETIALVADEVTLAPAPGEHYYYARLTQDDGKMLWSAPVWVTQQP